MSGVLGLGRHGSSVPAAAYRTFVMVWLGLGIKTTSLGLGKDYGLG